MKPILLITAVVCVAGLAGCEANRTNQADNRPAISGNQAQGLQGGSEPGTVSSPTPGAVDQQGTNQGGAVGDTSTGVNSGGNTSGTGSGTYGTDSGSGAAGTGSGSGVGSSSGTGGG